MAIWKALKYKQDEKQTQFENSILTSTTIRTQRTRLFKKKIHVKYLQNGNHPNRQQFELTTEKRKYAELSKMHKMEDDRPFHCNLIFQEEIQENNCEPNAQYSFLDKYNSHGEVKHHKYQYLQV
jgi:hypothetical protein